MNIKHLIGGIAIAAALALSTIGAAMAGPLWNNASAPLADHYGDKYDVPDWTFTKAEFGNTDLGAVIHLGAEALLEVKFGFIVDYNPATDAVNVYKVKGGGDGDDFNPGVIPHAYCASLPADSPRKRPGGNCDYLTSNATLAPGSAGMYYSHTIAATARECEYSLDLKGAHEHSC